jgi:hypothetical protein
MAILAASEPQKSIPAARSIRAALRTQSHGGRREDGCDRVAHLGERAGGRAGEPSADSCARPAAK